MSGRVNRALAVLPAESTHRQPTRGRDPRHAPNNAILGGYSPGKEPLRFPMREQQMADKSPRHSMSKKSGKSIKEKRVERKAKADSTAQMERLTREKKH